MLQEVRHSTKPRPLRRHQMFHDVLPGSGATDVTNRDDNSKLQDGMALHNPGRHHRHRRPWLLHSQRPDAPHRTTWPARAHPAERPHQQPKTTTARCSVQDLLKAQGF